MANLWQDILDLLQAPFIGQLDLEDLFLVVGVVLVFIALWGLILYHIQLAASEI
jgi:hypothetical protein